MSQQYFPVVHRGFVTGWTRPGPRPTAPPESKHSPSLREDFIPTPSPPNQWDRQRVHSLITPELQKIEG